MGPRTGSIRSTPTSPDTTSQATAGRATGSGGGYDRQGQAGLPPIRSVLKRLCPHAPFAAVPVSGIIRGKDGKREKPSIPARRLLRGRYVPCPAPPCSLP